MRKFKDIRVDTDSFGNPILDLSSLNGSTVKIFSGKATVWVDPEPMKVGQVLGEDYQLPKKLERLRGWLVTSFTWGVPNLLEPEHLSFAGNVNMHRVVKRKEEYQSKGHPNIRLWTSDDIYELAKLSADPVFVAKAKLVSKADYFMSSPAYGIQQDAQLQVCTMPGGAFRTVASHFVAHVRFMQSVPELRCP